MPNPRIYNPTFVPTFALGQFSGQSLRDAIDFTQRNYWEKKQTPGLPPAYTPAPQVEFVGGQPTVNGVPLAPLNIPAQEVANTPLPQSRQQTAAITIPERYGDMIVQNIAYAASGDIFILPRPTGKRAFLLIINELAAPNQARVNFDKPADVNSGFPIDAGGNVLFDAAVPQNDLHVWTAAAGTITVAFINVAVSSNVAQ